VSPRKNMNTIAFKIGRLAAALTLGAGLAAASPIINILYDPTVTFTAGDKTQIQDAINFYTSNMTSNLTLTIAFGGIPGGGAQSSTFDDTASYSAYHSALVANSSGDATDTAAIASLGGANANNPVTGSNQIQMTSTLAAYLGVGSQVSDMFAGCDNLTANACIQVGTNVLNASGSPMASLMGTVEHEVDEVFGTSSALPNGGGTQPMDPSAADLFRYSSPGVRSFAQNSSTSVPCTGTPMAYFSINGGTTNLNNYNNCNNGGDYGDWIHTDGLQVQDAFGPDDVASLLALSSPEVTLLDAVGYNFTTVSTTAPEPSSMMLLLAGLAALPVVRKRFANKPRG
jgi:hypothetical protein